MKKVKLDKEEVRILKSVEAGEWVPVTNKQEWVSKLRLAAKKTMLKDYRMNIRVSRRDIYALKSLAMQEGIPYQTLVSSVLHKYVSGRLIEQH